MLLLDMPFQPIAKLVTKNQLACFSFSSHYLKMSSGITSMAYEGEEKPNRFFWLTIIITINSSVLFGFGLCV
jgi:hypothetical protein